MPASSHGQGGLLEPNPVLCGFKKELKKHLFYNSLFFLILKMKRGTARSLDGVETFMFQKQTAIPFEGNFSLG